jgi:Putative zinc-finger
MADPEDGRMNGEHLDEGVVHAWLDGQLSAPDAARIESHIAGCAACAAMVAEARGFMAASSRILTGLDGVSARVVPRSRSRARMWQVRAAAAVIVVALGAAAVLSDPGGRFSPLRREIAVPQPPAAASPALARAKAADTVAATPPATQASPSPPSPVLVRPRAAVPAPLPHEKRQENKKETALNEREAVAQAGAAQADAMRKAAQPPSSEAARVPPAAPQAATLGAQATPPARQDAPAAAPSAVSRSALAAKAAPSAVGGNAMQQSLADSSARANMAGTFSVRRLASNAAYQRCAGKVVTVAEPAGGSAGAPPVTTVRLDSAAQSFRVRGFVVTAPDGRANLNGWWVPAGADSAVVSLAGDSAPADVAGAIPSAVTRVYCPSP